MISEKSLLKTIKGLMYILPLTLLFYWRSSVFPFITVKVYPFQILVELLALTWFCLVIFYPKYRPRLSPLSISLAILILVLIVAAIFGSNPHRSFWSTQERGIGLVAILHFFALFLIVRSLAGEFNWRKYLSWIFILSLLISAFAILPTLTSNSSVLFDAVRPGGFFGGPSFLASFLIFTICIGLWLGKTSSDKNFKMLLLAGSLFEVLVIFMTGTRGAIIGLILIGLILLFWSGKKKIILSGSVAAVIFIILLISTHSAPIWQKIPGVNRLVSISAQDGSVTDRLVFWGIALKAFKQKPILGWGFENFRSAVDPNFEPKLLRSGFTETFFDKPHNIFLEMLISGGALGLLAYLSLLGLLAWILLKKTRREFRAIGLAALVGYVAQNFFLFDTFGSYFLFFLLFGLADGLLIGRSVKVDDKNADKNSTRGWALAVLAAIGAIFMIYENGKIVYANHLQYNGLNFAELYLPGPSTDAFSKAISIPEPYRDEIAINYVQKFTELVKRGEVPNEKQVITEALLRAETALNSEPDNYVWHLSVADARTIFSVIDKAFLVGAEEEINQAIKIAPKRQQSYYVKAKLAFFEKGAPAAQVEMQKAIDLDPVSGEPHFYYGLLAFEIGKIQLAIEEFEKARAFGRLPQNASEYKTVGSYYGDAESYGRAEEYLKQAAALDKEDVEIRLRLGLVYYYWEKPAQAKEEFEIVLTNFPGFKEDANYQRFKPIFEEVGTSGA